MFVIQDTFFSLSVPEQIDTDSDTMSIGSWHSPRRRRYSAGSRHYRGNSADNSPKRYPNTAGVDNKRLTRPLTCPSVRSVPSLLEVPDGADNKGVCPSSPSAGRSNKLLRSTSTSEKLSSLQEVSPPESR